MDGATAITRREQGFEGGAGSDWKLKRNQLFYCIDEFLVKERVVLLVVKGGGHWPGGDRVRISQVPD